MIIVHRLCKRNAVKAESDRKMRSARRRQWPWRKHVQQFENQADKYVPHSLVQNGYDIHSSGGHVDTVTEDRQGAKHAHALNFATL